MAQAVRRSAAEKHSKVEKYAAQLKDGIARIRSSEDYAAFLETASMFHSYSFNNIMMIFMQRPDATRVAGYSTWKKLGRHVNKGEKGIRIYAPLVVKETIEENGTTTEVRKVRGFRMVSVFDVSQTDGEPLPGAILDAGEIVGTPEDLDALTRAVASVAAFPIYRRALEDGARGLCSHATCEIVISDELTGTAYLRTLVHETAHSLLHKPEDVIGMPREVKEVQAESVAYMVCRHYGVDTDATSFGYIAGWAQTMTDEQYIAEIVRLQKAAASIIGAIDSAVKAQDSRQAA